MDVTAARTAVRDAFDRRTAPGRAVAGDAERIARACHAMAVRFHEGGRLIVFGNGGPCTDAQHVAVEFVHPVVVGKRALPAFALTGDVATLTAIARDEGFDEVYAAQLRTLARPDDIALGLSAGGLCGSVRRGLAVADEMGLLTVALTGGDDSAADHVLPARTDDPLIAKEVHVTVYHVLWELVHVFFQHPGTLRREAVR